jgi:hypothetical protein
MTLVKSGLLLLALGILSMARTLATNKYSSLAEAISAARNGDVVLLPEGDRAVLHSQLIIAGAGITLRCAERAAIIKGFNGDAISISGSAIVIDGCTLDGQGRRYSGGLFVINGATDVTIRKSILFNSAGLTIGIYRSSNVRVLESTITGNQGSAFFAQDDLNHIEIASNTIDSSMTTHPPGIDTIGVHTYLSGGRATGINIHDNNIRHGGDNFAVEIGAFGAGAAPPTDVTVARNSIVLAGKSNGGISFSTLEKGSIVGNTIDAEHNPMNIAAIELVSTRNVTASGNIFRNAAPFTTYVMSVDGGSANTIVGNQIEGGIYAGTSRMDSPRVDNNVIRENVLSPVAGSRFPHGLIWFQCNVPNCSVSRNQVMDNRLNGTNSPVAVILENDYGGRGGRVESNEVRENQLSGIDKQVGIGPGVGETITDRRQ